MKITRLLIPDVLLILPIVFEDDRGFFFESYNQKQFEEAVGQKINFVQDNHSKSAKGVLRGLHYQLPPMAQGKLIRVIEGAVFDVAVDIRKGSKHFGNWVGTLLTAENKKQLWIPEGFAHGFITLTDTAEFLYKTTNFYAPEYERCIRWDDKELNIDWQFEGEPALSAKDKCGVHFNSAEYFE